DFENIDESKRIWDENGDWYITNNTYLPLPEGKTGVLAFNDTGPENITRYLCTNEIFKGNFEISLEIEAYLQSSMGDPVDRLTVEAKNNLNGCLETLYFFETPGFNWKNLTVDLVENIPAFEFSLCLAARYVDSPRRKVIYLSRFKATLLGKGTQPTEQPTTETPTIGTGSSRTTYSSAKTTEPDIGTSPSYNHCIDGWSLVCSSESDCSCFRYLVSYSPFDVAVEFCDALGGILPSFHSEDKNNFIYVFQDDLSRGAWIGLKRKNITFEWMDGSMLDFTSWNDGSPSYNTPNKDCVHFVGFEDEGFTTQFRWQDSPCSELRPILCEMPILMASLHNH
ncbi:hypothetical protein QYM36_002985, partial [Artemia franciscana]